MTLGGTKPLLAIAAIAACCTLFARAAFATPRAAPTASTPEATEEARTLMMEGNAQLHAGKPADALAKLERSFALVPSPNTELLVGRALRDLGRRVEAVTTFEHAEAEARRRALAGEVKYGQTEAAAHSEGASVKSQLGTLRVHVAQHGPATLFVDGRSVPLAAEGDTSLLHEPGRAEVVVRNGASEQKQIVSVVAGATIQMEFAGRDALGPERPTAKPLVMAKNEPRGTTWTLPAALVAGGLTLAGAGSFAFFGSRSESTWEDLSGRCGPSFCGATDRAEADRAKSDQTIANVSLGVAAVAAAATIAFVVLHISSRGSSSARLDGPPFARFHGL